MKALIAVLVLLPTLALADSPDVPDRAQLQPYYPSPYADRNWLFAADCYATVEIGNIVHGACRYYGNGNELGTEEGWANVDWVYDKVNLTVTPISATPCDAPTRHRDNARRCRLPNAYRGVP